MSDSLFKYGILENVRLTPIEYDDLCSKMGQRAAHKYIDQLSTYIPNRSRRPYKDHRAVILQWWLRDRKDNEDIECAVDEKEEPSYVRRESFQERSIREQKESSARVRESLSGAARDRTGLEPAAREGVVIPAKFGGSRNRPA